MSMWISRRLGTAVVLAASILGTALVGSAARAGTVCRGVHCPPTAGTYAVLDAADAMTSRHWEGSGQLSGPSGLLSGTFSFDFAPLYESRRCEPGVQAVLDEQANPCPIGQPVPWRGEMTIRWAGVAQGSVVRWDRVQLPGSPTGGVWPAPWQGEGQVTRGPLSGLSAAFSFAGTPAWEFTGTMTFSSTGQRH